MTKQEIIKKLEEMIEQKHIAMKRITSDILYHRNSGMIAALELAIELLKR